MKVSVAIRIANICTVGLLIGIIIFSMAVLFSDCLIFFQFSMVLVFKMLMLCNLFYLPF